MRSQAYIAGVLDTLVKAGEMSPAYAAGVADVLAKQAMWWNTIGGAQREFRQNNPGAMNPDGSMNISPDQAVAVANRGVRHWWNLNRDGVGWGDWAGNKWDMAKTYVPEWLGGSSADRRDMIRQQYKVMQNKALLDRINASGEGMHPSMAGALQDAFVRDANDMYNWWTTSSNRADLKPGMAVAVSSHPHTTMGQIYGHIGMYIGNGMMMDNIGYIRTISVNEWINFYSTTVTPRWGWLMGIALA
jgi:hypothetical protein